MSSDTHTSGYRRLLWLYPRSFRDEYGDDMIELFVAQRRNESAARVWVRAAVDLTIAVPTQHLEVHMHRPPTRSVQLIYSSVCAAGALVAIIAGSPTVLVVGSVIALIAGVCAVIAGHSSRSVRVRHTSGHAWWRFLTGGGVLLGAIAITTTATGPVPDAFWLPTMIGIVVALGLLATGLILAISRLTSMRAPTLEK